MRASQAVTGAISHPREVYDQPKQRKLQFGFNKPNSSEGPIFGFWYRVIIILVSTIPAWLAIAIAGAWNDYNLETWMFVLAAALAIVPLTVAEVLRRSVYEKTLQVEAEVVKVVITRSGLKLTSEDYEQLEDFKERFSEGRRSLYSTFGKRIFDLILTIPALLLLAPLMIIIALFISLDGHRPIYSQERIGYKGKVFRILKFRTMVDNADEALDQYLRANPEARIEWDTSQKLRNDPRITPFGVFLRKTSLDELPQLLNVLVGQMSLVGPRPIMVGQAELYSESVYYTMKPGLTGLWQISARSEASLTARYEYDREYSRRMSLLVDLSIILRTVSLAVRGSAY